MTNTAKAQQSKDIQLEKHDNSNMKTNYSALSSF